MRYKHFGAIGDIIKHLFLCEFLRHEKPLFYAESNAAGALYAMDTQFNRQYGISHFFNAAKSIPIIFESDYIQALIKFNGPTLSNYLGSPALAMTVLGNACHQYLFCDIDQESLDNIHSFVQTTSLTSKIKLHHGDGNSGVLDFVKSNSSDDYKNIFVHLDPYNPMVNDYGKVNSINLFVKLINLGVKVMMWFGYMNLVQRSQLNEIFSQELGKKTAVALHTAETMLNVISDLDAPINPGILGCGVIFGNQSEESLVKVRHFGSLIEEIYRRSLIDGKYDGGLKFLYDNLLTL